MTCRAVVPQRLGERYADLAVTIARLDLAALGEHQAKLRVCVAMMGVTAVARSMGTGPDAVTRWLVEVPIWAQEQVAGCHAGLLTWQPTDVVATTADLVAWSMPGSRTLPEAVTFEARDKGTAGSHPEMAENSPRKG